jgi:cytochrome P450
MHLTQAGYDEPVALADVDLYPAGFYRTGDPHAAWHTLRRAAPVWRQAAPDGMPFWSVTRYDDVVRVLKDTRRFSSEYSTMLTVRGDGDSAKGKAIHLIDPPKHRVIRAPAAHQMSMRVMHQHEARIAGHVRAMIADAVAEREIDFARLATAIPMAVTGEIIGIPQKHWADVARWTIASMAPDDPFYTAGVDANTLRMAHVYLFSMLAGLIADRREEPADDLISLLLSLEIDGEPARDEDVLVNCYAFLMGANPTIPQAASQLMLVLLENPGLWRELPGNPALTRTTVEEALRWASPVNHLLRRTTEEVRLGGEVLPAGSLVAAWIASANRDEAVFPDPYVFDPRRDPNPQIAFGVGPHRCIGNPSARTGLTLLLRELTAQVESVELAGSPQHLESNFLNGVTSLPIVLHAAARSPVGAVG